MQSAKHIYDARLEKLTSKLTRIPQQLQQLFNSFATVSLACHKSETVGHNMQNAYRQQIDHAVNN